MAEFSELVSIKKRICAKYKHNSNCNGCPVGEKFICGIISISDYDDMSFMVCEDTLLSWARENPEPKYPTWEEWLITQGVIKENQNGGVGYPMPKLFEPISVEIAEKLGLRPKEY